MLKRLRIKFILINMMMAVLVLATTFSVVCYLDYSNSLNSVYGQLNNVLARVASSMVEQIEDVRFLDIKAPSTINDSNDASSSLSSPTNSATNSTSNSGNTNKTDNDNTDASTSDSSDSSTSQKTTASTSVSAFIYDEASLIQSASNDSIVPAPNIGTIAGSANQNATPTILVAVYKLSDQGFYTTIPDFSIASISENVLLHANNIVKTTSDNRGYLSEFDLCFERMPTNDGFIVAYADASSIHSWKNLAFMLLAVGVAALLLFLLINLFFARWALRPVAQSIKQQQQFTADASHELKTPLTVILANMSILESQPDSTVEEQMQWIESTQTEAMRMQLLVNEMLNLARPNEDKPTNTQTQKNLENKSSVDFSDLVEGEVLQFESVAFERGIEMNSDIKQGVHVYGDAERLGRMVSTLIDNACKYTSENGKVNVTLTSQSSSNGKASKNSKSTNNEQHESGKRGKHELIKHKKQHKMRKRYEANANENSNESKNNNGVKNSNGSKVGKNGGKNGCIILKVHNNGMPISEEDLPHLFDRFYRADKARTSGKGGYGLGLAIGREIAREHKGDITVTSTKKEGTVFTVSLPLYE